MTPERWQRVKELFDAALDREPGLRARYLAEECAQDEALRAEVASLLAQHRDDSFIERPILDLAALGAQASARTGSLDGEDTPFVDAGDLGLKSCPTCSSCFGDGRFACPEDGSCLVDELYGSGLVDSKYEIERRLGQGGMGVVYLARHVVLGRKVALKLIRPGATSDPEFVARFRREAAVLGRLEHPGIVDVTEYGIDPRDGGLPYLVMEHLEGTSLHDHARRSGVVPLPQALAILEAAAAALDFAHSKDVLHRDLKDANVFLCGSPDGPPTVKLLDFGLARLLADDHLRATGPVSGERRAGSRAFLGPSGPSPTVTLGSVLEPPGLSGAHARNDRLTRPGQIGGTLEYLAPEVLGGGQATVSSDLYAFAAMAYRLLVGRLPFEGTHAEIVQGHVAGPPPRPSKLRPSLPPELDAPLLAALAKEPSRRPASATALVASLQAAHLRSRVREWRARETPRRVLLAAGLAMALTAAAFAASPAGPVRKLELATIDARFALRPSRPPDPRIVIVSVDEASLSADRTPMTDRADEFGRVLSRVFAGGARAVAIDFVLHERWRGSAPFSRFVLENADRVTLAVHSSSSEETYGPEALGGLTAAALGPQRAEALFGFVNLDEDPDGVIRRARVSFPDRVGGRRDSWATRAVRTLGSLPASAGPDRFWIDFSADPRQFSRISWKDLPSRLDHDPFAVRDRLVLVGAEFEGSGDDLHRVPHRMGARSMIPGIVLQALSVDTVLAGLPVREVSAPPMWLATGLVATVLAALVLCLRSLASAAAWAAAAGVVQVLGGLAVFRDSLLLVPMVAPLAAVLAAVGFAIWMRSRIPSIPRA